MKLKSVLCLLLLLATNTEAGLFKKNKDGDNRRRLTEKPATPLDADAATGTVKPVVSDEEEQAKKAAQTCDGQMALSLAQANEEKINAEAAKTQALEQAAAMEKSLNEMSESKRQLEVKMEEVIQEKDAKVKSLMDSLESSTGGVVAEYEGKMSDMAKAHANEVATLNTQFESAKESSSAKVQELENTIAENAKAAEDALAAALKEMEDKHAQELAKLKEQMAAQQKQAADTLAKQEEAAKATLKTKLDAKDEKIKAAVAKAKKAEQEADDAEEELEMWRKTHENRTYCNYTYLTEDIYWAGEAAYNSSWTAYEGAANLASKASANTYHYTDKASQTVKPHYDKHVKPHYDKHVNPLVAKVYESYEKNILPKIQEFKKAYNKQFNKLARKYATACDKAFTASSNLARKKNVKAFDNYIAPYWQASCDHPKDTLTGALMAVAFALLLPYIFSVLRFVRWLVLLPFRIIIIAPLRFLVSLFIPTKKTPTKKKTGGQVRVKSKKPISTQ